MFMILQLVQQIKNGNLNKFGLHFPNYNTKWMTTNKIINNMIDTKLSIIDMIQSNSNDTYTFFMTYKCFCYQVSFFLWTFS